MKHEHIAFGAIFIVALVSIMVAMAPRDPVGEVLQAIYIPTCTDSDGGQNVFERGTVQGDITGTDYCIEGGRPVETCRTRECKLVEFYCKKPLTVRNERGTSKLLGCPPTAVVCEHGRCVEPTWVEGDYIPYTRTGT